MSSLSIGISKRDRNTAGQERVMVEIPLVALLVFIAWVMVRRGGWKFAPLGLGFLVGLLTAATQFGPELTQTINQFVDAATHAVTSAVRGGR